MVRKTSFSEAANETPWAGREVLAVSMEVHYMCRMSAFSAVMLIIAALTTLGILATGIIGMMIGGEFNRKYSNKLMRARVLCQFMAVIFFALFIISSSG